MAKLFKNTTGFSIELKALGITIPASSTVTVAVEDYILLSSVDVVSELTTHINSGDIVVNDGVDDITVANGFTLARAIDYLKYPDDAFNIRFAASPERMNGYVKKNVQEAIEETAFNAGSSRYAVVFAYKGIASNKWLELFPAIASDNNPFVIAEIGQIASLAISAKNSSTGTVTIYLNGIAIETILLTATKTNVKVGLSYSLSSTDEISAKVTSGSISDPVVIVNIKVL